MIEKEDQIKLMEKDISNLNKSIRENEEWLNEEKETDTYNYGVLEGELGQLNNWRDNLKKHLFILEKVVK